MAVGEQNMGRARRRRSGSPVNSGAGEERVDQDDRPAKLDAEGRVPSQMSFMWSAPRHQAEKSGTQCEGFQSHHYI